MLTHAQGLRLYASWNRLLTCPACNKRGSALGGWMDGHVEHVVMPCGVVVTFKGRNLHRCRCSTCQASSRLPTPYGDGMVES